jgi:hypothetical protein
MFDQWAGAIDVVEPQQRQLADLRIAGVKVAQMVGDRPALVASEPAGTVRSSKRSSSPQRFDDLREPAQTPAASALVRPPRLRPGDTVGLVNPAGATWSTIDIDIVRGAGHFDVVAPFAPAWAIVERRFLELASTPTTE